MSIDSASELVRHTLILTLIVAAPMLVIGLAVGIVLSLVQAVTQIQEQTLTFIPKITAMILAAIMLMPWIEQHVIEFAQAMFTLKAMP